MAQYWTPAGSYQTVKVVSQTSAPDVEAVGIYTKPSGVYTVALVPLPAWKSGAYAQYLDAPALLIEQLMGLDTGTGQVAATYVTGAQYVQAEDANGLLAGFMDFTVTYVQPAPPAGTFQGTVRIPMTSLESFEAFTEPIAGGTPSELIVAEHARLQALASA